jgi:hypothetical protein
MKKLALFIFASSVVGYWCSPITCPARTGLVPQASRWETDQDPDQADERIYAAKDVDSRVKILSKPQAKYTPEALQKNVVGVVALRAIFTSKGEVRRIEALKRLPAGLTESATAAAGKISFTPAMKDGHPVSMWMQLEYTFESDLPIIRGQHFPKLYYDRKCRDYSNIAPDNMVFFVSEQQAKGNGYKKSKVCP